MANYVETVAKALIKQLEAGTAPWIKPWQAGERFLPYNPTTDKPYHGMNVVWLLAMAQERGYTDPRWLTYRQAQEQGAPVRRGEKGTVIQYWKWQGLEPVLDAAGQPVIGDDGRPTQDRVQYTRPRVWSAVVFNAAQIDGLASAPTHPTVPDWARHAQAERLLHAGDPTIHYGGDRAAYNVRADRIVLPERAQFATADAFYATALHEKGHWTGHPSRLNRDLAHPFGSEGYAREELRAEIASLMLGEQLGIGHDPGQHAAYIQSWIRLLQDDPKTIFRAAGEAEKIVTYVHGLAPPQPQAAAPAPTPAAWTPDLQIEQTQTQQEPAFFDSNRNLRDSLTGEVLPADWCGIAQGHEFYWYIGQENGERTFNTLAARTLAEAKVEAALVKALAVDIGEILNNPDAPFTPYRSYQGVTLDEAMRRWSLTTVGSVTGYDPTRFYEQAHNRLSPIFGIAYDHDDMDGPYLERKGLAQAFEATARQIHQALQQRRAVPVPPDRAPAMPDDLPAPADTVQVKMPVLMTEPVAGAMPTRTAPVVLAVPYAEKDDAKRLGARWDRENKVWYASAGVALMPLERWLPDNTPLPIQVARDPRNDFAAALREAGFLLDGQPDMDGQLRRVRVEGDKPGERSGAYVGHLDSHPAGYIQNFKTGLATTWKAAGRPSRLDARDRARLNAEATQRRQARAEERERQYEQAAEKAEMRWAAAVPVEAHPYLTTKNVPSYGLRQEADGNLVVPVRDLDGKLWSLQAIDATGRKAFQKDARAHGGHFLIGDPARARTLLIAEGYATAASLHLATGQPVAVTFTAGNLDAVAAPLRREYPAHALVIAADNDQWTPGNPGLTKARAAAARHGATVITPDFTGLDVTGKPTDFNDLARLAGLEEVRRQMASSLTSSPESTPPRPAAPDAEPTAVAPASPPVPAAPRPPSPDSTATALAAPPPVRPGKDPPAPGPLERPVTAAAAQPASPPRPTTAPAAPGLTINTIESVGAAEQQQRTAPPPGLVDQYTIIVNRYYFKHRPTVEAFVDHGDRLRTRHDSPAAVQGMLALAESRGWDRLKVSGSAAFRQTVWLEASLCGLAVSGYPPTARDQVALAERRQARERESNAATLRPAANPVPTAERQAAVAAPPSPVESAPSPAVRDPSPDASQPREARQAAIRDQVMPQARQAREQQAAAAQAAQERQAAPAEKARQLRDAFETLDKRMALERFPELTRLYPLVAHAARFAREQMPDADNRAVFVEGIKARGIQALAQGETLPLLSASPAPSPGRSQEKNQDRRREPVAEVER